LKPTSVIPPVVALVIAGGWIGSQRQSITTLEKEIEVLRKHIAARASGAGENSQHAKPTSPGKSAKDKQPLDWKKIASQFAETQRSGGIGDMRTMMRFQQRLQAMTQEELVAALDEIAALDLPAESRAMLEQMLIGPLVQKDPELALTRFIDRIQDQQSGVAWQLSSALQEWAKKDPAKASAWFDRQIAAGKFDSKSLDGKSRLREQFEGGLINVLLASDLNAADRRLGAIPEDQRSEVMSQFQFQQLKDEDQLAFAKLIRGQVPENQQADTLAQQASRMVSSGGYSKVTEYLDRIEATPTERAACAEEVAESKLRNYDSKKITREDLDSMREWVGGQAPESLGRITGKVLGNALQGRNKMEFSEAADLAVQYNQTSGNDEVLASFLESWPARENKEQARGLADKIADEKRREQILKRLK
jgi:hypothetical protein